MPSNIKCGVSINSGPVQQGPVSSGIPVVSGDVVQLSGINVSGAKTYRFEIYDYPPGFTTPAGWTQDVGTRIIYYAGPNPPTFTIFSGSSNWGKWNVGLIIDGGKRPSSSRPGLQEDADDLKDFSVGLVKASTSGLKDTLFGETNQFHQLRYAVQALKDNWRLIDALLAAAGGGEANTASNVGTDGVGVFEQKDGVNFEFRNVAGGFLIDVVLEGTNIVVQVNQAALEAMLDELGGATVGDLAGDVVGPIDDNAVVAIHSGGVEGTQLDIGTLTDGRVLARVGSEIVSVDWILRVSSDPNGVESGSPGDLALSSTGQAWINVGGTVWTELAQFGAAGGDLDGSYPDPAVVAVHAGGVGGTRLPIGTINEGEFVRNVGGQLVGSVVAGGGGGGASNGIPYTYNATTTMADPGTGLLRLNNATMASVTAIALDSTDANSIDVTSWLGALDDSNSAVKCRLRLASASDATRWVEFDVISITQESGTAAGWYSAVVVYVAAGNALLTTTGDTIASMSRTGDPGSVGIPFTFDTGTTNADPGNGEIRLNNATVASATRIYVDLLDANGRDITTYLDSLDDSTSTIKGVIQLRRRTDPTVMAWFQLTAVTTQTGYRELTIVHLSSGGSFVTTAADVYFTFFRTGDKGADGNVVDVVGLRYTYSTTTTNSDPGAGVLRLNNATLSSVTAMYIDNVDGDGGTLTSWFATWDDSTNPTIKGTLLLRSNATPGNYALYHVSASAAQSGYYLITLAYITHNGTLPTTANDIQVTYYRTGDRGAAGADGADGADGTGSVDTVTGVDGVNATGTTAIKVRRSKTTIGPFSLGSDQNNWNPTNWDTADVVLINPTTQISITGAEPPTTDGTWFKRLVNVSGTASRYITLPNESGSSTSTKQWYTPGGADFDVSIWDVIDIFYSSTHSKWLVASTDAIVPSGRRDFTSNQSMGDNGLLNCRTVELNSVAPGTPATEKIRLYGFSNGSSSPGAINVRPTDANMLVDFVAGYETDTFTADVSDTLALNFASIGGRDLSDGVFKIQVQLCARSTSSPGSYPIVFAERWFVHSGGLGVQTMQFFNDAVGEVLEAHWNDDGDNNTEISASISGDTVNIAYTVDIGTSSGVTWRYWIIARITGGP